MKLRTVADLHQTALNKSSDLGNNLFDWSVGWFGINDPLRQYFSLYHAVSKEREKEDRKDR